MKTAGKNLLTLLTVIAVSALAAAGFSLRVKPFDKEKKENKDTNLQSVVSTEREISDKVKFILICGLNADENNMTDLLAVACLDIKGNNLTILQIPRDCYIGDGVPTGKINAVYSHPKQGESNINSLIRKINEVFAVPIDNYIIVEMNDFAKIIDHLGGVEVKLSGDIYDSAGSLKAGNNLLDGKQAMWFMRHRESYNNGDIGRLSAQRQFYAGFFRKIKNAPKLALINKILSEKLVSSDLTISEMISLSNKTSRLDEKNIKIVMVPGKGMDYNGYSVYGINKNLTVKIINEYLNPYNDHIPAEKFNITEIAGDYDLTENETDFYNLTDQD